METEAELKEILSANIKTYRKEKCLSQEQLADICGLHRTYIGSVERKERNVTLSTLAVIANALGITALELLRKE